MLSSARSPRTCLDRENVPGFVLILHFASVRPEGDRRDTGGLEWRPPISPLLTSTYKQGRLSHGKEACQFQSFEEADFEVRPGACADRLQKGAQHADPPAAGT